MKNGRGRRCVCSNCKKRKKHFGHGLCQACYWRVYYRKTPVRKLKEKLARYQLKVETFNAYGGCICACCKETEMFFLTLDHINGNGAKDRRERKAGGDFYRQLKKEKWPKGFQVLCMNCNFGKRMTGSVCPHKLALDVFITDKQFDYLNYSMQYTGDSQDMGWESISLTDIPQETERTFTPIPDGIYTLQLMGASENQFRPGGLNISVAVADGTEYAGKRIFVDLPDAEQMPWAKAVLARMFEALGTDIPTYNFNAIEELNRLANNGHSRFKAAVYTENYKSKTGEDKSRNKINFRSIAPAV